MNRFVKVAIVLGACVGAVPAMAQSLIATTASASNNSYSGSLSSINDGVFPANGTNYQTNTVHDYNRNTSFTLTFTGGATSVGYFNANVDNNDDYTITLFNGVNQVLQRTILLTDGNVGSGTENFTSNAALAGTYTYVSTLSFSPVTATRAVITSANGDGNFAIGEVDFFTAAASAVPESTTWAMMILGVGAVGFAVRRRVRRSEAEFDAKIKQIAAGEIA